jgi:hypothetical protein
MVAHNDDSLELGCTDTLELGCLLGCLLEAIPCLSTPETNSDAHTGKMVFNTWRIALCYRGVAEFKTNSFLSQPKGRLILFDKFLCCHILHMHHCTFNKNERGK